MRALLLFSLANFFVQSNIYAQIPNDVNVLMNKQGVLTSTINGKAVSDENGSTCEVIINPYSSVEDDSIQISSPAYFNVTADLKDAIKETSFDGTIVYVIKTNGKRPGGSACGSTMPVTKYKKTVETKKNKLTIRETFRCLLSKYEVIQSCVVKK